MPALTIGCGKRSSRVIDMRYIILLLTAISCFGQPIQRNTFTTNQWNGITMSPFAASLLNATNAAEWTLIFNGAFTNIGADLQAWWSFDEASGVRADSVGANPLSDNNSVLSSGGVSVNTTNSAVLSGANYLSCANSSLFDGMTNNNWTICHWVNIDATCPPGGMFLSKQANGGATGFYLFYDGANGMQFHAFDVNGADSSSTLSSIMFNNWYLFAATYNNTSHTMRSMLFDVSTNSFVMAYSLSNDATSFGIGARADDGSALATGKVDETAIWYRILTDDEIAYIFNFGQGRHKP